MCHRYQGLPAITPIAGAAVDVEDLTLTASDGVQFAAFHAKAESPTGPGMVILPDVRSYDEHVDACNDAWQRIQSFIASNS
jgi:carboxymethylenebutenolidase